MSRECRTFDNSDGAYSFSRHATRQMHSEVHLIRLYDTTQFPFTAQAAPMP